jgi:hypothetical protein
MRKRRLIFSVDSPLGYRVILDRNRWKLITRFKHPALAGKQELVKECVADPETVRQSENDADVHVYYRRTNGEFICVVAAPIRGSTDRFVVTAYIARKLKKGNAIWTK